MVVWDKQEVGGSEKSFIAYSDVGFGVLENQLQLVYLGEDTTMVVVKKGEKFTSSNAVHTGT